jgi:prepilin peptidase CpaA
MLTPSIFVGAIAIVVPAIALAWGAVNDVRAYEIPNFVCLAVLLSYPVFALVTPTAPRLGALATGACILAAGLVLFARGWMGGGDIKLLSAVAVWSGPALLPSFAVVTGVSGAVLAGLMLTPLRRLMPPAPATAVAAVSGGSALTQPMPFGVAIAVGGAWVLAQRSAGLH